MTVIFELWTGTPNVMQKMMSDQSPGGIRRKAKEVLAEMTLTADKFEKESIDPIRSVMEEVKALVISDIPVGYPFRRLVPLMGVTHVIEIRRT